MSNLEHYVNLRDAFYMCLNNEIDVECLECLVEPGDIEVIEITDMSRSVRKTVYPSDPDFHLAVTVDDTFVSYRDSDVKLLEEDFESKLRRLHQLINNQGKCYTSNDRENIEELMVCVLYHYCDAPTLDNAR